ncbi:MAG: DegV family protein [Firmicutes bacterium]|nr:DegV family protein [Bacillota bacterium]
MKKFIISADSTADYYIGDLKEKNIYCLTMKYIIEGKEYDALYEGKEQVEAFYEKIKAGALPTTTQLNEFEYVEHFEKILAENPEGDIIHVTLSSGLSGTYESGVQAAAKMNEQLVDRKIYIVDSLLTSLGMQMMIDKLLIMRENGVESEDAVQYIEKVRDRQQIWVIVDDLFHLKRGGRLSAFKATIGTLLKVKPIIVVNKKGKLVVESSAKGSKKAIQYVLDKIVETGENAIADFTNQSFYMIYSTPNSTYDSLKETLKQKYPTMDIKEIMLGPVVGSHVGCGVAAVLFEGAERFDFN